VSAGAVVLGHGPLARAVAEATEGTSWDGAATLPAGAYGVVIQAATTDTRSGARALEEDIAQTKRAIALATELGIGVVLVSRLSAVGARKGLIAEEDPRRTPFGARVDKGLALDVDKEIADLDKAVSWARARVAHADERSRIATVVRDRMRKDGGATRGRAFHAAVERAIELEQEERSASALVERAAGWGFETGSAYALRGYTCALAELLLAASSVPWCIVRAPDVLEGGALEALLSRVHDGVARLPFLAKSRLEALPAAHVAADVAVCARALQQSKLSSVVHVCTSDRAPLSTDRLVDLMDLYVRRRAKDTPRALQALAVDRVHERPLALDVAFSVAHTGLSTLTDLVPNESMPDGLRRAFEQSTRALGSLLDVQPKDRALCQGPPFFSDETRFSQRGLRAAAVRAGADAQQIGRDLDWRGMLLEVVLPALDEKRKARGERKEKLPRAAYDSLGHLVTECADRYGSRPALSLFSPPGVEPVVTDVSYQELYDRARAVALRLQRAGVEPGDRVALAGSNHPAWPIVAFGAALCRATLVPLDPTLERDSVRNIMRKAKCRLSVVDKGMRERFGDALPEPVLDLQLTAVEGPGIPKDSALPEPDDVASILFTSGTTGEPKGVMLMHRNFCALLASLQAVFPTTDGDRMLSVLPLHHTFEFSCGMLMPLASGARIYTPDALTGERVLFALKHGRITALVGVPALWQLLERRITKQAQERGDTLKTILDALLSANRKLGAKTGLSFGSVVLKPIHDQFGGHLRVLISGGSALPPAVHEMFQGLGLPLAEGYGLTESAPVLTIAEGKVGMKGGTVGKPIPGVTLKIVDPDPLTGVGEVWAQAPNVMKGYFEDEAATRAALEDGWLKTGDLGVISTDGVLTLVGRSKDVVVSAAGENIYLDDVEKKLEEIPGVTELTLLGIADPRGGERLGLAAVAADTSELGKKAALDALKARVQKLPQFQRAAVIEIVEGPLPRTSTRKVKRKDVRKTLEALAAENRARAQGTDEGSVPMAPVRAAISLVAGVETPKLAASTRMAEDLGFDSLMWVELQGSLEQIAGTTMEPEVLAQKETIAAVESYVRERAQQKGAARAKKGDVIEPREPREHAERKRDIVGDLASALLPVIKPLGRTAIATAQRDMFRTLFDAHVTGRAHIPYNRNTIVVANHTSHLDTGLVKFALDSYGKDLRPLAAKDYFFEGARAKVAFFEHFTNLVPIDRETGSGLAFEQAKAVVQSGHVALIFPEGTRREDGTLGGFKPLVARLALATDTDVLPIWMKGNFDALPRGVHVPNLNARHLEAHIGPALPAKEMARLTAHLPNVQAARAATEIIRAAIVALSEGRMLELHRVKSLEELTRGVVERPAAE
jgi:long-chain acyl-CoA synthetase